jgi:hypothetical protein
MDSQDIRDMLKDVLSRRDLSLEALLKRTVEELRPHSGTSAADEASQQWMEEASTKISDVSLTLSHRLAPLLQHMLSQKLHRSLTESYAVVPAPKVDHLDMAIRYRTCFNLWVDASDCVSFQALNTRLLGNLSVKDYFILTAFAFATVRRVKGDNVLQLGCVGSSTTGKSTFLEHCLAEGAHTYTPDGGVGRFNVDNKVLLFAHDIPIKTLVSSKDADKFRTIARTEVTTAKSFGATVCVPSLFLIYTSNERLLDHSFPREGAGEGGTFLPRNYPSQATGTAGKKRVRTELLRAIQMRVVEMFIRRQPKLDADYLPRQSNFQRMHMILGLFERVARILEAKSIEDFYSPLLAVYAATGLCKNFATYAEYFPGRAVEMAQTLEVIIYNVVEEENRPALLACLQP